MCICLCRGEAAVVRTPVGATEGHKQTKTGKRERGEEGGWKERKGGRRGQEEKSIISKCGDFDPRLDTV